MASGRQQRGTGRTAQDGGDDAAGEDFAHPLVLRIGDVQGAGAVHRQARGKGELGGGGRAAIAAQAGHAGSRHGGDFAVGRHFAHAVAFEFRDIEVAGGIHGHVAGGEQLGAGGRAAVAGGAFGCRAGDGGDGAIGADPPHAVVAQVGNVQVSREIHGQAVRKVELGGGGRAAIAAEAGRAGAGEGA